MKKKALMAIVVLCYAMAMTACGGNTDTAEVKETTVAEESVEADAQTEAEVEEQAETEAEKQAQIEEAGKYYEAGRRSLYGLDGAQIDLEDAHTNFTKSQELGNADANFYLGVLADWYGYPKKDYEQARAYYEQSGDNPYAQIALGCLYYLGHGVEPDIEKGKELFQSAVDQGVVEGYYGLAKVAENAGDIETALEHYNKVVQEGAEQFYIVSAMSDIGYAYDNGFGVEQDGTKAVEWYTKAADLGDLNAMFCLGRMYEYGVSVEQDGTKAVEWYTKAADLGHSEAMYCLGYEYYIGFGVEQDGTKAVEWYTKAADLGHSGAMYNLGNMYDNGGVVEQDSTKAVEWYTKAADLDYSEAMYCLGNMYDNGFGVEQDSTKAIEWYTKAADLGHSEAMNNLGYMYAKGDGVEQNNDKALEWYVKSLSSFPDYEVYKMIVDILHGEGAAEKWFEESGDAEKMMALAGLYRSNYSENGEQVLPDFDKAIEWYTKAADLGNTEAMKMIGYMYTLGSLYGGEDDLEKAIEWYQKAADLGNADAQSYLERLQEQ